MRLLSLWSKTHRHTSGRCLFFFFCNWWMFKGNQWMRSDAFESRLSSQAEEHQYVCHHITRCPNTSGDTCWVHLWLLLRRWIPSPTGFPTLVAQAIQRRAIPSDWFDLRRTSRLARGASFVPESLPGSVFEDAADICAHSSFNSSQMNLRPTGCCCRPSWFPNRCRLRASGENDNVSIEMAGSN